MFSKTWSYWCSCRISWRLEFWVTYGGIVVILLKRHLAWQHFAHLPGLHVAFFCYGCRKKASSLNLAIWQWSYGKYPQDRTEVHLSNIIVRIIVLIIERDCVKCLPEKAVNPHSCKVTVLPSCDKYILQTWIYELCYHWLCLEILWFDSYVWTVQKYWTVSCEQSFWSNFSTDWKFKRYCVNVVAWIKSLNREF